MTSDPPATDLSLERFAVAVFSELPEDTIRRRWREVNVLLRMSMLTALDLQMDATLNMISDFASEIVQYDRGACFLWDEDQQTMHVRVTRNMQEHDPSVYTRANVLNFWATKAQRPLLIHQGEQASADGLLASLNAKSVLVIPLFAHNRVVGSLQLYADEAGKFTAEDAQLLWALALVSENLITRDYGNEALLHFAFTDFLTGMKTRGYFEQQLDLELKRAERRGSELSLLMLDLDHFKALNDGYGHHVGDQLLRDVSTILMKDMREVDTVARYGGEEFVIILPDTSEKQAQQVAQRLRKSIAQAKFFAGSPDRIEHLTISIGLATYPADAQFKRELIENADAALYDAKTHGRDRVVLYSEFERQRRVS